MKLGVVIASSCLLVWIGCATPEAQDQGDAEPTGGTQGSDDDATGNQGGDHGDDKTGGGQAGEGGGSVAQSGGGGGEPAAGSGGSSLIGGQPGGSSGQAAGNGGSSVPAGPGASPCSALPGCEGFETHNNGAAPGMPWRNFETPGGSIVVDESKAFSGKRSVKITATAGNGRVVRMQHSGNGLLPADQLYARMMVWLDAAPQGSNLHWNWIRMGGDARGESGGKLNNVTVSPGGSSSGNTWTHYGGGASGGYQDCFAKGSQKLPTGRWACVEVLANAASDDVDMWIDGKRDELTSLAGGQPVPGVGGCVPGHDFTMGRWPIPKINLLAFGFSMAHTLAATRTMWIDDVVVSTSRVGCPKP